MITLYHGSNMAFSVPDLSVGRQGMDFGKEVYTVEYARNLLLKRLAEREAR